jgi:glutamine amidotransferase
MKIAIIKYNAGNIRSVSFALERLGIEPIITDKEHEIKTADKVIFPGVGEASTAMNYIKEKNIDNIIFSLKQPVLGICLGMQLLCKHSEENNTNCLSIFDVTIKKFSSIQKVPQIGWNTIYNLKNELFTGIKENEYVYFVHSYYAENNPYSIATTQYSIDYSSALQKDNFYAVQFHPEKSAEIGAKIIQNFIQL